MRQLKIIIISLLLMAMFVFMFGFIKADTMELIPIPRADGDGYVLYRNTSIQAQMPKNYIQKETDFRAVWVSPLVGDFGSYVTESSYKAQIYNLFSVMEYYNMNAVIFHMRIFNDALYKSELNPVSSYMEYADFDKWDPVAWMIDECHKRGIEFHAWLNPYRISSSTTALPLEEYAQRFPSYNIASDPRCILKGSKGMILNPGEPRVRAFLMDTCMEIIENYDIDAIHFDDYFYINGIDDTATQDLYNNENLSEDDFRRRQVDIFIKDLSNRMREYNTNNERLVQLGISPTGIYRNGGYTATATYDENGNLTSPVGSNTSGYSHYDSPLYSDTKKWVDNEWIDYIVPQIYWSFEEPVAGYADVTDWWVWVVKYKNVNLYSGMGLYMAADSSNASWHNNPREAANQVQYASQYEEIKGHVIFSYSQVKSAYNSSSGRYYQNLANVKDEMWKQPAILPEVRNYPSLVLPAITNLTVGKTSAGYRLDFTPVNNAKFYVIYRGTGSLNYDASEVIDVIGDLSVNGTIGYIDEIATDKNYIYGVKAMSPTNSLGEGSSVSTVGAETAELLDLGEIENIAIPETAIFNTTIQLRWPNISTVLGGPITYTVYKSFDNLAWEKVTTVDNPIEAFSSYSSQKVKLDKTNDIVYFRIDSCNRTGNSTTYFNLNVYERIGFINNFTAIGDIYGGETINFKWTKLIIPGVTYKVQYSDDGFYWNDITSESNPVVETKAGCLQSYTMPVGYSNYYYRLVASTTEGIAGSVPIRLEAYDKIGDFTFEVNGKPYQGPINVKQNETVIIKWYNHSFKNEQVQYRPMVSVDMKNWFSYKIHNLQNTLIQGNDFWNLYINPDFKYYILYIQVEAMSKSGRSYSDIIELRVEMDYMLLTQFCEYIIGAPDRLYNKIMLFR